MGKGGSDDIDIPDLDKIFPGLITPSFSLLPQSQTAIPNTTVTGTVPTAPAPALNRTARGGTAGARFRFNNQFPTGTLVTPFGVGGKQGGIPLNQLSRAPGLAGLGVAQGLIPGGRGGGAPVGGGGGGDPFVLSRTGPFDPFQAEEAVLGGLQQNRARLQGLIPGIRGLNQPIEGIRGGLQGALGESAAARGQLGELGEEVQPGFGRLTATQVQALRNREAQAQGNLRESLRNRRVLGSSFGIREQERLEREFGQEEERVRAESFLQELDTRRGIIGDIGQFLQLDQATFAQQAGLVGLQLGLSEAEAGILGQQLQTIQSEGQLAGQRASRELQELAVSGNIINQVTASATQLAGIQAQASASEAAGFGELIGSLAGSAVGFAGLF